MASEHITHVSDDSFENDVLKASGPVLVDLSLQASRSHTG